MADSISRQQVPAKRPHLHWAPRTWAVAVVLCLAIAATAQSPVTLHPASGAAASGRKQADTAKPSHITPEQAKQLFSLVDELLKFSSTETGLPIKSAVNRKLTTRAAVESYLQEKFNEDSGAKRLQRDEIVLKKFGLLDRDFALKPFLLALLKEQIEAYYDSKSKTVNMLDWVDIDEQKPVLAHELTHALQDQHANLEKWSDQTPEDVSTNSAEDTGHLAKDEMDTARDAVAEGQATAVMMNYILKPMGKSLVKDPELLEAFKQQMNGSSSSPVMARAPLLLSESMLFPYREGLSFEQDVWMDQGREAAFSGALDHPPTSSWEIINPREYEKRHIPSIPLLPDIHPLVDKLYKPYDIGQIGQLDVHILTTLFGGDNASRDLTPAWNGGLYWAGQLRSATTPAQQSSTKSLALLYLSVWRNRTSAQAFARLYAASLGRKYSGLKVDDANKSPATATDQSAAPTSMQQVFSSSEGPIVITTRGNLVFVAESFPLDIARNLADLILDAQGTGEMKMAQTRQTPGAPSLASGTWDSQNQYVSSSRQQSLSSSLVRFFSGCGVLKSVVQAGISSALSSR